MSPRSGDDPERTRGTFWERWAEVDALLEAALDRAPDERDDFLARACGDDVELQNLVAGLLGEADDGETDTDSLTPPGPLVQAALGVADAPGTGAHRLLGTTAGPYRLMRILGAGGMGTVFHAERADGAFQREVAVKVLHPELATRTVVERFRREGQILASLGHPSVAHMLDGGVTDEGRPYLVMEYVEGEPIDAWARSRRLGVEDRIGLMLQVCDAVEHAHQHLVIHRDLKPSNILVDASGRVKLLDFGIAKVLDGAAEDASPGAPAVTRADARFVTPEYAAPEQLLGEPVSTRTDVYALAGLLYELLTGQRPYESRPDGSVLERMIRGDEPTAPSANVGDPPVVPGFDRQRLRRRIGGDLDAILLRALQTRPEARYTSVGAFRDELERHLSGRPVAARGDARWYLVRRFVRRHRIPVSAAAALLLVVAGSAVGLAIQQRAVLAASEQAAVEAEKSREVTEFLMGLFEAATPEAVRDDSLTVQALLARGTDRIDALSDQPAVQADLLETLGRVHTSLGTYDAAISLLERAVAAREEGAAHDSIRANSLVWLGVAHSRRREFDAAVTAFRAALDAARTDGATARSLAHGGLSTAFTFLDMLDSAEVHSEAHIALLDTLGESTADARSRLGTILRRRGDESGAATAYEDAIDAQRTEGAMSPIGFVALLNNLAFLRRTQERYDEAYVLYSESHDSLEAMVGPGHPDALMVSANLAQTTRVMGRRNETLAIYTARVAAAADQWPEGHWRRADALVNQGAELIAHDRYEEALLPLAEALDMGIAQLGARHIWNAGYRGWLALAAARTGRAAASEDLFRWSHEGLDTYTALLEDASMVGRVNRLADALEEKGLPEQAARYRAYLEPTG